jgi:hypothetical protein
VWGPVSGCTAACRLIVHTPCVFNVPTFPARRPHVTTTLEILAAKGGTRWARTFWYFGRKSRVPRYFRDLLHAATRRPGPDGCTSPPKEVALTTPTASAGFEPANSGTKGQLATPRPPKPLRLTNFTYYNSLYNNIRLTQLI